MRFRRLPGVIGPCPSTTLDKSFIYFLRYCIRDTPSCQQIFSRKKEPFSKFANLHSETLENGSFSVIFLILQIVFIDENTAELRQTKSFHEPLALAEEQIIEIQPTAMQAFKIPLPLGNKKIRFFHSLFRFR